MIINRSFRIVGLGALVSAFLVAIGPLEGKLFPVADNYKIISEKVDGNDLVIQLRFEKHRDCKFSHRDWYIYVKGEDKDRFEFVDFRSPGYSRPLGSFLVKWVIKDAAAYIGHKTQIVTEHFCWGPLLWSTKSVSDIRAE